MEQTRQQTKRQTHPINQKKILEVAFWGTVIWGIIRMMFAYFSFTPYGVEKFSRPFYGPVGEDSYKGIFVGFLFLFVCVYLATAIFAFMLSERKNWSLGIVYGIALFLVFGLFFRMQHWKLDTFSTELAWFISIGVFIGMSMTAEQIDQE
ncbi:YqhR family membrane protein [Brevibacillus ginsengisoli]|uniref:YqhR family membrane protein n=1 Tax=Brevibacillus ginsengisoli TaxID=363854 RepID=UPI003CF9624F